MANRLQQLGFRVITANNSGRAQFLRALQRFTQQVNRDTDIALFYYSGHGLQYEGESYLVPVDAHIETGADVPITAINAKNILNKIQKQNSEVSIMVLDACRNMPFNRGSKDISVGLASIKANDSGSTIIAYATAEGAVASDGIGSYSPYTTAFLNNVQKNVPLSQLFNNIAYQVKQTTGQDPWISQSSIPPHIILAGHVDGYRDNNLPATPQQTETQPYSRYSKISYKGSVLPTSATTWACARDNNTGLLWESKNRDRNSLHYWQNRYRWGGVSIDNKAFFNDGKWQRGQSNIANSVRWQGGGTIYHDWDNLVNASNREKLCGASDWRVPTVIELYGLVTDTVYADKTEAKYINQRFFPNTYRWYWSATPHAKEFQKAWDVSFVTGSDGWDSRKYRGGVRLVSGE